MSDLRGRFRTLDDVPVQDLREEIERRVELLASSAPVTDVVMRRPRSTGAKQERGWRGPTRLLAVAVVGISLATGGLLVGSWWERRTEPPQVPTPFESPTAQTPSVSPTPRAVDLDCETVQRQARRVAVGWDAGPAPAPSTESQPGWIAVWGTEEVPEVILVDPVSGERCPLVRFEDYASPLPVPQPGSGDRDWIPDRGPLAWSPDGKALAIVVWSQEARAQHLFVWSARGIAGPLLENGTVGNFRKPAWSPDSSMLAIVEGHSSLSPATGALAWIVPADGSANRAIPADCKRCNGGAPFWSPDGERIAFETRGPYADPDGAGIAVGRVDGTTLPILPPTEEVTPTLLGWRDDGSLLFSRHTDAHFASLSVSQPDRLVALGPTGLPPDVEGGILSPDGARWLRIVDEGGRFALVVTAVGRGETHTIVNTVPAFFLHGWAPDSRSVGYLIDLRRGDRGIWTVDASGSNHRRVIDGEFALEKEDLSTAFAWQPVWP